MTCAACGRELDPGAALIDYGPWWSEQINMVTGETRWPNRVVVCRDRRRCGNPARREELLGRGGA
jgi:hypothetical protein